MIKKEDFFRPSEEYSMIPFWFWNADLNNEELINQLYQMKEKGISKVIIHARKGLTIPYLGNEWFSKMKLSCQVAKKLGMTIFVYDENNWPSGYADGKVIEKDPFFAAKCLSVEKIYPVLGKPIVVNEKPNSEIVSVIAVYQDKEFIDITDYGKNGKEPWASKTLCWEVFVFRMENCAHCPAYSNLPYVDLLNKDATDAFIASTHEQYKINLKEYYGSVIKGFFTDEPGFYQNYLEQAKNLNTIIWTKKFPTEFKEIFGYDLRPYLPTLFQDMPVSSKIRKDYYKALTLIYKESFFDEIRNYLHKDGLILIGHLHREEKLEWLVQTEGNFFSAIDGLDYSGLDCINRDFPRISEKLASSAADLLNKPRTLSETFGCFSWGLTPNEIKERIDLQYVQGVNLLVPHAFFYSIEGVRKNECPPSLFIQNPYWPYFRQISDYVSRLSYVLSNGKHDCKVGVYYPSRKATKLFTPLNHYEIRKIDECLDRLVLSLLNKGIDFTLLNEDFIEKAAIKENGVYIDHLYKAIVCPCSPDEDIKEKIEEASKHCNVVILGENEGKEGKKSLFRYYQEDEVAFYLCKKMNFGIEANGIFSYSRKIASSKFVFLLNYLNRDNVAFLNLNKGIEVEQFDLETGTTRVLFASKNKKRNVKLTLSSKQSILLCFKKGKDKAIKKEKFEKLPLTFVSSYFNKKEEKDISAHKNNIKNFDGKASLSYKFYLEKLPSKIKVAFSNATDFASIYCNDKYVQTRLWQPFEFDITPYCRQGENFIRIDIENVKGNAYEGLDLDCGLASAPYLLIKK